MNVKQLPIDIENNFLSQGGLARAHRSVQQFSSNISHRVTPSSYSIIDKKIPFFQNSSFDLNHQVLIFGSQSTPVDKKKGSSQANAPSEDSPSFVGETLTTTKKTLQSHIAQVLITILASGASVAGTIGLRFVQSQVLTSKHHSDLIVQVGKDIQDSPQSAAAVLDRMKKSGLQVDSLHTLSHEQVGRFIIREIDPSDSLSQIAHRRHFNSIGHYKKQLIKLASDRSQILSQGHAERGMGLSEKAIRSLLAVYEKKRKMIKSPKEWGALAGVDEAKFLVALASDTDLQNGYSLDINGALSGSLKDLGYQNPLYRPNLLRDSIQVGEMRYLMWRLDPIGNASVVSVSDSATMRVTQKRLLGRSQRSQVSSKALLDQCHEILSMSGRNDVSVAQLVARFQAGHPNTTTAQAVHLETVPVETVPVETVSGKGMPDRGYVHPDHVLGDRRAVPRTALDLPPSSLMDMPIDDIVRPIQHSQNQVSKHIRQLVREILVEQGVADKNLNLRVDNEVARLAHYVERLPQVRQGRAWFQMRTLTHVLHDWPSVQGEAVAYPRRLEIPNGVKQLDMFYQIIDVCEFGLPIAESKVPMNAVDYVVFAKHYELNCMTQIKKR